MDDKIEMLAKKLTQYQMDLLCSICNFPRSYTFQQRIAILKNIQKSCNLIDEFGN